MKTHPCKRCSKETANRVFCSTECKKAFMRGPNDPKFKGGTIDKDGYRQVRPIGAARQRREHRTIMEAHLGRPLLPTEVVHHKDGNPLNNAIENLELFENNGVHRRSHFQGFRSETHKQCHKCGVIKPRTEFWKGQSRRPGDDPQHTECKDCRRAYFAARYHKRRSIL